MLAGRPAARPPERPWSSRSLTHRLAGSASFSTAWPATTVEPASASREVTMPSAGASRRTFCRCCASAALSAWVRVRSWRAPARLACAALRAASAEVSSCTLASAALGLMKSFWRKSW